MKQFVGKFTRDDIINGVDRVKIKEAMEESGLQYILFMRTNTHMRVWICDLETYKKEGTL